MVTTQPWDLGTQLFAGRGGAVSRINLYILAGTRLCSGPSPLHPISLAHHSVFSTATASHNCRCLFMQPVLQPCAPSTHHKEARTQAGGLHRQVLASKPTRVHASPLQVLTRHHTRTRLPTNAYLKCNQQGASPNKTYLVLAYCSNSSPTQHTATTAHCCASSSGFDTPRQPHTVTATVC